MPTEDKRPLGLVETDWLTGEQVVFQPGVNQELVIDDVTYCVAEHPAAPGIPYGQEGRAGIVYQLVTQEGEKRALKVFKPRYRLPALVGLSSKLATFADLPGLSVCRRTVLSARRHGTLLRQYLDLTYAVLMPWIEGPTWFDVIEGKRALAVEESLILARSLTEILTGMEEHNLAHCDLSGPNVLLPALAQSGTPDLQSAVALVDVEQLYGPGLTRPELLPSGSSGYTHKTAREGLWMTNADRFAGAVLLAEMLGWCDGRVRETAWGENYFESSEMQQDVDRYRLLADVLHERWNGAVADLFEQAWHSETLADCATFGEWLVALPERSKATRENAEITRKVTVMDSPMQSLIERARQFEEQGQISRALDIYRQAQTLAAAESGLADELSLIVESLQCKQREALSGQFAERAILDEFFDDGFSAYQKGEWAKAKELLSEVVKRQPDYEKGGKKAGVLLAGIEEQGSRVGRKRAKWLYWILASMLVLVVIGCATILVIGGITVGKQAASSPMTVTASLYTTTTQLPPTLSFYTATSVGDLAPEVARTPIGTSSPPPVSTAASTSGVTYPTEPPPVRPSPTITPRCSDISGPFAVVWKDVQYDVGCASGSSIQGLVVEENFEEGKMFWREPVDYAQALVLFNDETWQIFEHSPFVEGSPEFSCPDADTPSQCPPTPKRGFGLMWCDIPDIRNRLGNATDCERGYQGYMQQFDRGFMIQTDSDVVYVFYHDGKWKHR